MAILFGMDVISLVFPMIIGTMIQSYMGDSLYFQKLIAIEVWKHASTKSGEVVYMPGEIATLLILFVSIMKYIVGVYKTVK
jgi:hypothetical protein